MKSKIKDKTKFFCQECGYESLRWIGKCPGCGKWNTFVEEPVSSTGEVFISSSEKPKQLSEIEMGTEPRFSTDIAELDRVLGGGLVAGSVVLIGGEPGIGKSTMLAQISNNIGHKRLVLYVSAEESPGQIKMRTERLGLGSKNFYVVSETNLDVILEHAQKLNPAVLVVDSIQTVYRPSIISSPGSVGQVKECTAQLTRFAKTKGTVVFIVGHITKDGSIAGPRIVEHIVDTVLYFEGDEHHFFRVLRTTKNRFGSTNEIGVFEMRQNGLAQVDNPSEVFLNERQGNSPGSVVVAAQEGDRPILVEIQALVTGSSYGIPQRRATGVDYNRVSLLMAVLEKRMGMQVGGCDVFVNVAGGIKIDEPAADLGILAAIASSFKDLAVSPKTVVIGEVGLSGEVRAVSFIERRIKEAQKLGFGKCVVPKGNVKEIPAAGGIEIIGVSGIRDAVNECLAK